MLGIGPAQKVVKPIIANDFQKGFQPDQQLARCLPPGKAANNSVNCVASGHRRGEAAAEFNQTFWEADLKRFLPCSARFHSGNPHGPCCLMGRHKAPISGRGRNRAVTAWQAFSNRRPHRSSRSPATSRCSGCDLRRCQRPCAVCLPPPAAFVSIHPPTFTHEPIPVASLPLPRTPAPSQRQDPCA